MKKMINWLKQEESGQGMVEYALIIALIAVLLIGGLTGMKNKIAATFTNIGASL